MSNIPKTSKLTLKQIVENLGKIPSNGFDEKVPKLTTEQKKKLIQMASQFDTYGHVLKNEEAIMNSAKAITELFELAENYSLTECGDWFQQDIVKKDFTNAKKRLNEYGKLAKECYAKMQQLGVAYDDLRHILGRYFDVTPQPSEGQMLQMEGTEESNCSICKKKFKPGKHSHCKECSK